MGGTRRPGFSDFEKAAIWRGWKSGETFNRFGRMLDRAGPHVRSLVAANGGFVPPPRRRSIRVLSRIEREEISRGVAAGDSMRTIATALERAPSTHTSCHRRQRARRHTHGMANPRGARAEPQLSSSEHARNRWGCRNVATGPRAWRAAQQHARDR